MGRKKGLLGLRPPRLWRVGKGRKATKLSDSKREVFELTQAFLID